MTRGSTGVSVIVCCHNGAARLPATLRHLAAQTGVAPDTDEVVLVDNGSTDGSAELARQIWSEGATGAQTGALRIVHEPRLGLLNARLAGIAAARFEVLSFVDDDNWVCADWNRRIRAIMARHPDIGVIGAHGHAAFENGIEPPPWFARYARSYAVGPQAAASGLTTRSDCVFYGAGLTLRKPAILGLFARGFRPLLIGRQGAALSAGDDSELCFALALDGWRFWYEGALEFRHFMPRQRLTTDYLKRMFQGFGYSSVVLDVYRRMARDARRRSPQLLAAMLHVQQRITLLRGLRARLRRTVCRDAADALAAELDLAYARGRRAAMATQGSSPGQMVATTRAWLARRQPDDPPSAAGAAGSSLAGWPR